MPPPTQKRRRNGGAPDADEPRRRGHARRNEPSDEEEEEEEEGESAEEEGDGDETMQGASAGVSDEQQLARKLVRYALACEHASIPIKRDGIRDKVLGSSSAAVNFRRVFDGAQQILRQALGMQMVELPARERRTLKEKRKAIVNNSKSQGSSSGGKNQYILASTLPAAYKSPSIVGPSKRPNAREDAEYAAFYTLIISIIAFSGGELSDAKLRRHLARLNAKENLPFGKTEDVLARMVRQGYVDMVVEKNGEHEDHSVSWYVGSRGRAEVPPQSIAAFARHVFGEDAADEDFQKRLYKSLGLQDVREVEAEQGGVVDGEEAD